MRFHDEVIEPGDLDIPEPSKKLGDQEAKMAEALVASLETEFDPTEYEDTYRERVLEVVRAKAEGRQITPAEPVSDAGGADLMALLEQSVKGAKKKSKGPAKPRRSKARA
jgi:DNA end-binding protein Ku